MRLFVGDDGFEEKEEPDLFLEQIKTTIKSEYFPIEKYEPGVIFMSSQAIYSQMQNLYPSLKYSVADIATWMHESGFHYNDSGQMQYEWMLKPK